MSTLVSMFTAAYHKAVEADHPFHAKATGVLSDAKEICAAVKRVSPDTLTALDGVCSVGSEEIRMDDWGVDIVCVCLNFGYFSSSAGA